MAKQRLEVMRETSDGFVIAEKDLELRGPGEVLGTRQTGELGFRIADLARDAPLLPAVQRVGAAMLQSHPALAARLSRAMDRRCRPFRASLIGRASRVSGAHGPCRRRDGVAQDCLIAPMAVALAAG